MSSRKIDIILLNLTFLSANFDEVIQRTGKFDDVNQV